MSEPRDPAEVMRNGPSTPAHPLPASLPFAVAPEPRVMPRDVLREALERLPKWNVMGSALVDLNAVLAALAAVPSESDAGLDVERLAAALDSVDLDQFDTIGAFDSAGYAAAIAAEYARLARQ